MRTAARAACVALPLLAACSGAPPPDEASASAARPTPDPSRPLPLPLPDVVARVNGQEIRIQQILPLARVVLDKLPASDREDRKPEALRRALDDYVSRELLLQEALARGISADTRAVEMSFDMIHAEHPDEKDWQAFLTEQAMDAQTLKAELRVQHTVAALIAEEVRSWPVPEALAREAFAANPKGFGAAGATTAPTFAAVREEVEDAVRRQRVDEIQAELVARLRARAKIELYI